MKLLHFTIIYFAGLGTAEIFGKYFSLLEQSSYQIIPPYFTIFDLGIIILGIVGFIVWKVKSKDGNSDLAKQIVIEQTKLQTPTLNLKALSFSLNDKLTDSQFVNMAWMKNLQHQNTFTASFGVIRVTCSKGDSVGTRAEIEYSMDASVIDGTTGKTNIENIRQKGGYLNWFSISLRRKMTDIDSLDYFKINRYLENTIENIHEGESKDLLVFYILENMKTVFLCSDGNIMSIGSIDKEPLLFQVEIAITAQKYPKTIFKFNVSVSSWEKFTIQSV